jgi:DNA-binding CsgD family transcriptional regulator
VTQPLEPSSRELLAGRELYEKRAWLDAHDALARADAEAALGVEDSWRLWRAASLCGREQAAFAVLERIYTAHVEQNPAMAARAAFWLAFRLAHLEPSRGQGWFSRAERALERVAETCVEHGYLEIPRVRQAYAAGDYAAALAAAARAVDVGERFADIDLRTFARNLQGRVLVRMGELEAGMKLIDEVMLAVTGGELSPAFTGIVYCSAIDICQGVLAFDRVREWSDSLSSWCDSQPQLTIFTGACLVCRAEVMELGGRWPEALLEAERAAKSLVELYGPRACGEALYRQGEIRRLRGELDAAEVSYREASQNGRDPQPGLALLRLAQGRSDAAAKSLRAAAASVTLPLARAKLLPALVEISLADGALVEGRVAAAELAQVATTYPTPAIVALAERARGAVELAEGDAHAALASLRSAFATFQRLDAPYLAAQTRVLVACACQALDDREGARLEADGARAMFQRLGAMGDLSRLDALAARGNEEATASGLTARELEVLRHVASGKTNKLIARELCLSEKTVDRHVSNILAKLEVPSRAAATAFAYENKLV